MMMKMMMMIDDDGDDRGATLALGGPRNGGVAYCVPVLVVSMSVPRKITCP